LRNIYKIVLMENYIFSGFGHALGKFVITNDDLEIAVRNGYLRNFSGDRIKESKSYQSFLKTNPGVSPFKYFAEHKMGFRSRNHVVPFPPTKTKLAAAENSLHLAVRAVENAFEDSGIHSEEIDAWFVSTATPHEQAPGLAATLKCYFVNEENICPTTTVTSACVGSNINIQRAIEFFKCHPEAKHIVIAHTEVMSALLQRKTDFVPFVTFADAAAAIVFSRKEGAEAEGVLSITNHEDLQMIDFLGATKQGDLYMDAGIVKNRATVNIVSAVKEVLGKAEWNIEDIDLFVPHQTGNAIVHGVAESLNFPLEKTYQEVQLNHGNLSGASIPLGLTLLKKSGKLLPGMKILTGTAGLGGEFGAYTYKVQKSLKEKANSFAATKDMQGKIAFVTGCSGALGTAVALGLAKKGCQLLLHFNSGCEKANALEAQLKELKASYTFYQADFTKEEQVEQLLNSLNLLSEKINFLIHTAAVTGSLSRAGDVSEEEVKFVAEINQHIPVKITKKLKEKISQTILYVGSVAEDAQFSGSSAYVQAKRGLHGFAASFSYEAQSNGTKSIYYMPGIIDGGMADKLDDKQKYSAMLSIGQEKILSVSDVAKRIVKSLMVLKIQDVQDVYESALLVRRDGYTQMA